MKTNPKKHETFDELEKLAHDMSDVKPLLPAMQQKWEAAQRTGRKLRSAKRKTPQALI